MNFLRDDQRGRKLWRVVQTSEKPYKSFRELYAQEPHQFGSQAVDKWSLWTLTARDTRNPVLQVISALIDEMDESKWFEYALFFYDNAECRIPAEDIDWCEGDMANLPANSHR